jgi:hypothetical protein
MDVTEQQKKVAAFILAKSGKAHLLQPIIARCEKEKITIWKHFEEGLVKQYGYTEADAQAKVRDWYYEYLATQTPSKS